MEPALAVAGVLAAVVIRAVQRRRDRQWEEEEDEDDWGQVAGTPLPQHQSLPPGFRVLESRDGDSREVLGELRLELDRAGNSHRLARELLESTRTKHQARAPKWAPLRRILAPTNLATLGG